MLIPLLDRTESGRVGNLERFSHYVARQLGFEDANECLELYKLAHNYLQNLKDCGVKMIEYFGNEAEGEGLYVKLMEEFERCILCYFAFHLSRASDMITQVLTAERGNRGTEETTLRSKPRSCTEAVPIKVSCCQTTCRAKLLPTLLPAAADYGS